MAVLKTPPLKEKMKNGFVGSNERFIAKNLLQIDFNRKENH
jgi:hypothetical protein